MKKRIIFVFILVIGFCTLQFQVNAISPKFAYLSAGTTISRIYGTYSARFSNGAASTEARWKNGDSAWVTAEAINGIKKTEYKKEGSNRTVAVSYGVGSREH